MHFKIRSSTPIYATYSTTTRILQLSIRLLPSISASTITSSSNPSQNLWINPPPVIPSSAEESIKKTATLPHRLAPTPVVGGLIRRRRARLPSTAASLHQDSLPHFCILIFDSSFPTTASPGPHNSAFLVRYSIFNPSLRAPCPP